MSEDWLGGDPFADPDDPTAREREERRREREERRRQRDAKRRDKESAAPPPPPPEPPAEPPPPPRTPEEEFWDEDPAVEEPAIEEPAVEEPPVGEPAAQEPPTQVKPPAVPPEPVTREPASFQPSPEDLDAAREAWTAPRAERERDSRDEGDPAMAGAARAGRRSWQGGGGRHGGGVLARLGRHPFRIAGVVVLLVALWFLNALFQPFHGDGSGHVQVTIPKGSSVSEVADLLGEKGVIDSSTMFQIRVTLDGKRSDLYAGSFTLAHGMSYGAAIDALSTQPVKRTTTVTIPEGYSRPQAAQLVEEDGIPGSYTKATVKSQYLDPASYGGKGAKNLEGFLFPDTFEMKPKAPVADLVQLQLEDFKRRIKSVDMSYAKSKNLTVYDVLTIASMIEREAGVASQRKLVASVIYNRLHEGMTLGIDATVRFATGNYTRPLTESELAIESPYNTRNHAGLPPGPIDSPGLEAIEAAAHPAKTEYLFYVTDPGTCGKLAFAKNEAEFEEDVARYNTAREEAGGKSPDTCGE